MMLNNINKKKYSVINPDKGDRMRSKLEFAIKSLDAIIWEYNLQNDCLFSDNPHSALNGGKNFEEYIALHHQDDRAALRRAFEELIDGIVDRLQLDVRVRRDDNSYIWIRIFGAVFEYTTNGAVRQIIGLRRDIQEQMETQIELLESKRKIEEYAVKAALSLDSGDIFIWNYNVATEIFYSHTKTSYMYEGISKSDFTESVYIDDRTFIFEGLRKFLVENSTEPYTCKIRVHIPEKGMRWVELTATILSRDSQGKPSVLTGLKRDVTKEHEMMEELVVLRNKAEEASSFKTAFFANMSHEIRTPLNAILGFSNLIVDSSNDESLAEYAKMIAVNNDLLTQLINDVLDFSRIEAGKLEFNMSDVCVNELMEQSRQMFQLRAQSGVEVIFDTPPTQCSIISEYNRLTQVITNFLGNAIKYTTQGAIHIGYELRQSGLYFYVTDTGKGIAEDNIPLIFNRFAKFDHFVQGTGLGLSICKMIIDRLGGDIGVESKLGEGSKFWFTLPCKITVY